MAPSIAARQRSVMPRTVAGPISSATFSHSNNTRNGGAMEPGTNIGNVAIVGGGLVGSMASCFLARRGYQVNMYEMRDDPRAAEHVQGKSINLALSERGRSALRVLGLEQEILDKYSIKMYGRMIHDLDGNKRAIPYGTRDQYILSVSRRFLNELLITEAEKYANVNTHFNHKMMNADLKNGVLTFQRPILKGGGGEVAETGEPGQDASAQGETVHAQADVIIGCDGAHSAVRNSMTKMLLLNYSQKYIEHGYKELSIPATASGDYAMEANYLHIWPRGEFMMIALPNLDKSFTVTLFMPFKQYDDITTEGKLMRFFTENFPDSIPLLTRSGLSRAFFTGPASSLISIKCSPYNYEDKVLLMGDAAHAMVPFYGQGMNCGFEDCVVLDELLGGDKNKQRPLNTVLGEFTTARVDNCHTIIDLAMYNYLEMRDLVNKKSFLMRKKLDNLMYSMFPTFWVPLYTMVTFTRIPYKKCLADRHWQDAALKTTGKLALLLLGVLAFVMFALWEGTSPGLKRTSI